MSEEELPVLIIKLNQTGTPTLRLRTKTATTPVSSTDRRSLRLSRKSICYKEKSVSPMKTSIHNKIIDERNKNDYKTQSPKNKMGTPRSTRKPVSYKENSVSPVKTPKRLIRKVLEENSEDDFKIETPKSMKNMVGTPRSRKMLKTTPKRTPVPRTPQKDTPKTPRSVSRKINMNQLTPSLKSRTQEIVNISGKCIMLCI